MARSDERTLPHDLEAERALLGSILLDGETLLDAVEIITPKDFYRDAHERIYTKMLELSEDREPVDFVTLKARLETAGELDEVGGPAYIASLVDGMPRGANVAAYAAIVRDKARLRGLILVSNKIAAAAYLAEQPSRDLQEQAERLIFDLGVSGQRIGGLRGIREIAAETFQQIQEANESRTGGLTGAPSGFPRLDGLTRGFQPKTLVIVAARPGMGKTSLVLNMIGNMAKAGLAGVVFSLEMSGNELCVRQFSGEARIDSHRMQSGYLRGHDWGPLSKAYSMISEWRLHIDDDASTTVYEMASRCRRKRLEGACDFIVVDYLQMMVDRSGKRQENRALELDTITRELRAIAKALSVPVIACSQLTRDSAKGDDHRPKLHHLRDSGALEQIADIVIGLHRDSYYQETDENRNTAEAILLKHRGGPLGTQELAWFPEETRYADISELSLPRAVEQPNLPDWTR